MLTPEEQELAKKRKQWSNDVIGTAKAIISLPEKNKYASVDPITGETIPAGSSSMGIGQLPPVQAKATKTPTGIDPLTFKAMQSGEANNFAWPSKPPAPQQAATPAPSPSPAAPVGLVNYEGRPVEAYNGPSAIPEIGTYGDLRSADNGKVYTNIGIQTGQPGGANEAGNIPGESGPMGMPTLSDQDRRNLAVLNAYGGDINKYAEHMAQVGDAERKNATTSAIIQDQADYTKSNGGLFGALMGIAQAIGQRRSEAARRKEEFDRENMMWNRGIDYARLLNDVQDRRGRADYQDRMLGLQSRNYESEKDYRNKQSALLGAQTERAGLENENFMGKKEQMEQENERHIREQAIKSADAAFNSGQLEPGETWQTAYEMRLKALRGEREGNESTPPVPGARKGTDGNWYVNDGQGWRPA